MKSIKSNSLLLPVFAAALIFCVTSRALGQGVSVMPDSVSPCVKLPGMTILGTYQEGWQYDTSTYFRDTTTSTIYAISIVKQSGDTGMIQIELPSPPLQINPGDVLGIPIHFNMQCPPTKDVHSGTFEL
ncbi:MAG: hypothetical protein ACHQM6_11390 [Candidatus Kapaibacterium sp.]